MNTKFYLDFRNKAKDHKGNLLLLILHHGKSASIPLGIRLLENEWDNTKIINRPDCSALNVLINKKKNEIDKRLALLETEDNFESMTLPEIKKVVENKPRAEQRDNRSVEYLFNSYMGKDLQPGTKEIYLTTLGKVKKYCGTNITINKINYEWLIGFDKFLSESQGVNGRGIYLRVLRTICNYAVNLGVIDKYPFKNFSIKAEQTRKRSVSVETLRRFYSMPASSSDSRYRDYFFLMFFLIGINAGDLLKLKDDAVVGNRLEYIRAKTHKKYSIKIEPEALELINRHKGKKYLLDALDTCKSHKNFVHLINNSLKEIGEVVTETIQSDDLFAEPKQVQKLAPVIPECSTYYSRHCWATFAYEIGIPMDTISQALGHASGNRTTLIYVKYDQAKVDRANREVIDYFFEGISRK